MTTISNPYPLSLAQLVPRVIRAKDAPRYLGMNRDLFYKQVKPYVNVIPIGSQGIGYDRLELDAWFEQYKERSGCVAMTVVGDESCQYVNPCQGSYFEVTPGTLTSATSTSQEGDFAKALVLAKKNSASQKRF